MKSLPSVFSYLTNKEVIVAKFIKPLLGEDLHDIEASPLPQVMVVRILTLKPNRVVPVHMHRRKEKVYICQGPGVFTVFMNDSKYNLHKGEILVVNAELPHAVACFSQEQCSVVVVSSSQDSTDIVWEDRADSLILETMHR
ncbi:MAG: cupin domain-containing protein [Candidatus Staskawiczbacteria bacterium]